MKFKVILSFKITESLRFTNEPGCPCYSAATFALCQEIFAQNCKQFFVGRKRSRESFLLKTGKPFLVGGPQ